jgi:F-type H+-transporting ATPase subunit a
MPDRALLIAGAEQARDGVTSRASLAWLGAPELRSHGVVPAAGAPGEAILVSSGAWTVGAATPPVVIAGPRNGADKPDELLPGEHFNFEHLNSAHILPYPAIEWIHGKPLLIFNLAQYADINYTRLSEDAAFTHAASSGTVAWATAYVESYQSFQDDHGRQQVFYTSPENLAKAMTVASAEPYATLPQGLSWINQQIFWSSIALVAMAFVMLVAARRRPEQLKPASRFQNVMEAVVLWVRDDIVRPSMPHADAWTPYFAALFLTILTCNLCGLIPLCATATGNIAVTSALALTTSVLMLFYAFKENGIQYFVKMVPIEWSWNPLKMLLWLFMFALELLQLGIRPAALALRLFVNMFAGHSVLLVFTCLGFIIFAADHQSLVLSHSLGVIGWVVAIGLYGLELLVAVLQAYIFTMLSAVFIGMCAHPEH